jgi:hypothetical protein
MTPATGAQSRRRCQDSDIWVPPLQFILKTAVRLIDVNPDFSWTRMALLNSLQHRKHGRPPVIRRDQNCDRNYAFHREAAICLRSMRSTGCRFVPHGIEVITNRFAFDSVMREPAEDTKVVRGLQCARRFRQFSQSPASFSVTSMNTGPFFKSVDDVILASYCRME